MHKAQTPGPRAVQRHLKDEVRPGVGTNRQQRSHPVPRFARLRLRSKT